MVVQSCEIESNGHVSLILYDGTYHVELNLYRHVTDLILAGLHTM